MTDDLQRLFQDIRDFGWNPKKREINLRERKLDFDDAREVLKDYRAPRKIACPSAPCESAALTA